MSVLTRPGDADRSVALSGPAIRTPDDYQAAQRSLDALLAQVTSRQMLTDPAASSRVATLVDALSNSPFRLEAGRVVSRGPHLTLVSAR